MPRDSDRDRTVDELLRQSLADGHASTPCPDAEQLAAWQARALSLDDATAVEAHLADCARCQAVVATLVRLEPTPSAVAGWRIRRWQWVTPLTAAAAAAALLVVVWRQEGTDTRVGAPVQMASNETAERATAPPPPPPPADAARSADETAPVTSGRAQAPADAPAARPDARPEPPAPDADDRMMDSIAPLAKDTNGAPLPRAQEAAAPPAAAAPSPPAAPMREVAQARQLPPAAELPAPVVPIEFSPPEASLIWRIEDGALFRRESPSTTWTDVALPPGVRLRAGASPSAGVCWVVGDAGVVLRSVDGATFSRTATPTTDDLTAVVAAGADTATVSASTGARYRTGDGGSSWEVLDSQF